MRQALVMILLLWSSHCFSDNIVRLTSLEWPPYSGKQLEQQGASVAVAKAAFTAMGYQLTVDFFPWSRAVSMAQDNNTAYAGYFPEYYAEDIAQQFIYSDEIGISPLGFIEQRQHPISWSALDDLKGHRIGVVQDYVNTRKFDAMANSGQLQTEAVISDKHNILKLINGRLDLAVIDRNVMDYLFRTEPSLRHQSSKAAFNRRLLANKKLYICFKKTPQGQKLAEIFNQGLAKIDIRSIMEKHL